MRRWLVERPNGEFEDVGFDCMEIKDSGALVFRKDIWGRMEYVLAPGQWLTVTNNDED